MITLRSLLRAVPVAALVLSGCASERHVGLSLTDEEFRSAPTLVIGDPAPALAVSEWVKGSPVARFEPGRVYVIDMWATWCAPCLASMEHSSNLQEQHNDRATFIALATTDDMCTPRSIRELVAASSDMRFRVAIDDGSTTADRYRRASLETAVPRAFVVDGKGRLAWIGHPTELDPVLPKIIDGSWDLGAARAAFIRSGAERVIARHALDEYTAASTPEAKLAALDHFTSVSPQNACFCPPSTPWVWRTEQLVKMGRTEEARAYARTIAARADLREEPGMLARLAHVIDPVDPALARTFAKTELAGVDARHAKRSQPTSDPWTRFLNEAEPSYDAGVYCDLAVYHAGRSEYTTAAARLETAVARLDAERFPKVAAMWKDTLASYRAAADQGKSGTPK